MENSIVNHLKNHPEGVLYKNLLENFQIGSAYVSSILVSNKALYSVGSRWFYDQRITDIENWISNDGASFTEIFEHFKDEIKSKSTLIKLLRASDLVQKQKLGRYYRQK